MLNQLSNRWAGYPTPVCLGLQEINVTKCTGPKPQSSRKDKQLPSPSQKMTLTLTLTVLLEMGCKCWDLKGLALCQMSKWHLITCLSGHECTFLFSKKVVHWFPKQFLTSNKNKPILFTCLVLRLTGQELSGVLPQLFEGWIALSTG